MALVSVCEAQKTPISLDLTPIETHHIAELNANQPYVAGYAAISPDLRKLKAISGATINISFMGTDPDYFPSDAWLGAGLFLQGQDNHYVFVDYGFYIMLVLDASGKLFLDIGLHQTRESSAPIQMPTSDLLYSYTWRISGVSHATIMTLGAEWDSEGYVCPLLDFCRRVQLHSSIRQRCRFAELRNHAETVLVRQYEGGRFPVWTLCLLLSVRSHQFSYNR